MYCTHCAKKIDERKLEQKQSSYNIDTEISSETKIGYICPRCGHVIHDNITNEEEKSLARAAHAELQRGRNSFAVGMGNLSIGIIALALAIIFFLLAKKSTPGAGRVLSTQCAEFYVSMTLFAITAVLLTAGIIYVILGVKKNRRYINVLRDIQNKTFIQ